MLADHLKELLGNPVFIAGLFACLGAGTKILWDLWVGRRRELESLSLEKQIELPEDQPSQFCWPIYIRLRKDNVIWRRILNKRDEHGLTANIGSAFERSVALPNHGEVVESKIHLAFLGDNADEDLLEVLMDYVNHIGIYQAIRATGEEKNFPYDFGAPYPKGAARHGRVPSAPISDAI
ncbi:hypothetical protein [Corallococcus exercitus]|uniref:Uncharacterized protein n=1 Tax=Corallococcus exercitus TaxID=2316736 RepID=A0A7Y4NHS5_9BACT|nr:hypothetical protein [Corallococcus exercitus]NOK14349.1 hypothetical protein [Corallococcus exercitus]